MEERCKPIFDLTTAPPQYSPYGFLAALYGYQLSYDVEKPAV